jgi:hypothetical protein
MDDEAIKDYIHQTNCKIVVNKLQKTLTYVICQQMDEMPCWHFVHQCVWESDVEISCKEITCELC